MPESENSQNLTGPLRASEWWESKFAPLFGIVYSTCLFLQISYLDILSLSAFLLVALVPGACFVSLINDLTDLEDDKLAGKTNRLEGKSKLLAVFLIIVCLAIGFAVTFFISKVALAIYLGAWTAFTLYSLPPIRLKGRGIWGVLADTLGANVFPQLFAVAVLFDWFGKELDLRWLGIVGTWSFLLGLRGIISHQLTDRDNDRTANVKTFVQGFQSSSIQRFFSWILFPMEICALGLLLYFSSNIFGVVFLVAYAIWAALVHFVLYIKFAIVIQKTTERLLLSEFYFIFFPISFLLTGLTIFPYSWIVLVLHLILFSKSLIDLIPDVAGLIAGVKRLWLIIREFLFGY